MCNLENIFEHQKDLMTLFRPIEEMNQAGYAVVKGIDWDMQDCRWQALVKDFTQRITEELIEALQELEKYEPLQPTLLTNEAYVAFEEELIDALHFLTEACRILGIVPEDIFQCEGDRLEGFISWQKELISRNPEAFKPENKVDFYKARVFDIIIALHMGTHDLKSRVWKRSHLMPSVKVNYFFIEAYRMMLSLANLFGMSAARIYEVYMKKNATNVDRAG